MRKKGSSFRDFPFVVVCSARALSNGCKSRVSPNSGNYIAKGKGVHREVKSERSRRQTSLDVVSINTKHTNGVILARAIGE